jgi:hypothetical protein
MKSTTLNRVCALCGERATKTKMATHLKTCAPAHDKAPTEPVFQLRVEAGDLPMFWIDIEAKALATLADLDRFLRKTWLEWGSFSLRGNVLLYVRPERNSPARLKGDRLFPFSCSS